MALVAGLAGAGPARATGRGLLVMAETLDAHALEPILAFSNARTVDAQRLVTSVPRTGYRADDLFLHDLVSGGTRVAEAEVGELVLVSPLEPGSLQLRDLFDAPGVAVLFESTLGGPADALSAEVFSVHRPLRGTAVYYRALTREVPEPDELMTLVCGVILLAALGRRASLDSRARESATRDRLQSE